MDNFWEPLYSEAAQKIKPSPIRDIFHIIRKPGMISFAGGMPDPEIFPIEQFYEASSIIRKHGKDILQYGVTEGYPPLKEFLIQWLAPRLGRTISMEEILITSGSIQATDLLTLSTINRGDYVITEEPTFLGATIDMYNHGARFLCVPCDNHGMEVDKLPEIIDKAHAKGNRIKYIYTIPNFNNPSGVTMSLERRKKLIAIAQKYKIAILEDDPYGYIRFEGENIPPLYSLDKTGLVIYAGSFSKILAPGTRVAWCCGNKDIIRKMAVFKQGVDTCTSVVAQALVYEYCRLGYLESFLPRIVDHYRKKRDYMEDALNVHLPEETAFFHTPAGGFFYWVETPYISSNDLFEKALEKNVAFVKGEPFYPNGGGAHHLRLCYTFPSPDMIDEGIRRLGVSVRELL
ncbi:MULTISPECIES: PLP-dependent aminotransferase family protein [Aminobacterium]|uniref:aminotransferase-like domain-containing protein n=1 Tax=Aminobacterium TaxID=81466 RepID=UPI000465BB5C|nr:MULTISPECIES: PLP-dependent aminotransferase family protein [Aminobacterium]